MFSRKTNVFDVIDKELERLHKELASFNTDSLNNEHYRNSYKLIIQEITKINDKLLELAELDVDNSH
jgi:hypothetical protein